MKILKKIIKLFYMILKFNHPFILISKELVELCKPLELFHIHHFTYLKKFNNGTSIALSNHPQWLYDYFNLGLYQSSLFEKKPSDYESDFKVWFGDYDLKVYQHGRLRPGGVEERYVHRDGGDHKRRFDQTFPGFHDWLVGVVGVMWLRGRDV